MGLPVRYADQTERGKKLARDTWEPRVRAILTAALTVAEAEGVVLCRVPDEKPWGPPGTPTGWGIWRGHNACRAATLARKVTL
jgi:hypothetical protein